ncbi:hypothetical protein DEFDS_P019 (plasmid) [Deferribacter desulfuricans SSM1]|uniref:Uncharacterized protein n=1 Tax=Deferribacter desulfuricans (strain DSM 14783 / JCM 11476 / NBRC 101012 / SSM1) TaxID=639282 RepID=D3PEK5_DEFDS|nr:hypothetical protein [Deferribacter desulfuricans]BAI81647.1 hypothetical protein DEFDS_P019 [Deferribacter desulfuricans SSM1]
MQGQINRIKMVVLILILVSIYFLKTAKETYDSINVSMLQQLEQQYTQLVNIYNEQYKKIESWKKKYNNNNNIIFKNIILLNNIFDIDMLRLTLLSPVKILKKYNKEDKKLISPQTKKSQVIDNYIDFYKINNKPTNVRILSESFMLKIKKEDSSISQVETPESKLTENGIIIMEYLKSLLNKYLLTYDIIKYNSLDNTFTISLTLYGK